MAAYSDIASVAAHAAACYAPYAAISYAASAAAHSSVSDAVSDADRDDILYAARHAARAKQAKKPLTYKVNL